MEWVMVSPHRAAGIVVRAVFAGVTESLAGAADRTDGHAARTASSPPNVAATRRARGQNAQPGHGVD